MTTFENPFKERQLAVSDTFLLSYGEENLTIYHALTQNTYQKKNRDDVRTQLTILDKLRKEAYRTYTTIQEEEPEAQVLSLTQSYTSQAESFWKYLPKINHKKTLTNPFLGSSSYSQYGPFAPRERDGYRQPELLKQSKSVKQMIRKEVSCLKDQVRRNGNPLREDKGLNFSVTKLYKQRKIVEQKACNSNISEQLSFCRPLNGQIRRTNQQTVCHRFQRTRNL